MKVILKNVRLAFPDLFEPVPFDQNGAPRYSANFLIEKGSDNHKIIMAAIQQVATETWKAKAKAIVDSLRGNSNKFCYTDGDAKAWNGAEGCMVLAGHRREADGRPQVVGPNKAPLTAKDGKIYSGCYVNASVDIWAQDGQYQGIRCTLVGVQFAADGEAFSGAPRASSDDFDLIEGADTAFDEPDQSSEGWSDFA